MLDVALGSIVTFNPQTISPEMPIVEALALMSELSVHHLPVVDDGRRLLGMISHRDLAMRGRLPSTPVSRVMARQVFTVEADAPPAGALQVILDHDFHSVPVLEEGRLIGMVTSSDFLRELSYGTWPVCADRVADHMLTLSSDELLFSAATATDALVEESSVVAPHQTLGTAAGLMLEYGVREIAVVDEQGNPVGVLRDDDVLQAIARSIN